jgi:hypothetical protein
MSLVIQAITRGHSLSKDQLHAFIKWFWTLNLFSFCWLSIHHNRCKLQQHITHHNSTLHPLQPQLLTTPNIQITPHFNTRLTSHSPHSLFSHPPFLSSSCARSSLEIPESARANLLQLTPSTYVGLSETLAREWIHIFDIFCFNLFTPCYCRVNHDEWRVAQTT